MIRPLVLIFLTLLLKLGSSVDKCNDDSIGNTLPDPKDCHGYYLCHSGNKLQQYCAPGMKYDDEIKMCVIGSCPPCNCAGLTTPTEPSTTTEFSSTSDSSSTEDQSSTSSTSESTESSIDSSTTESPTTTESSSSSDSSSTEDQSSTSSTSESTESSTDTTSTPSNPRPPVSCENVKDGSFFSDLIHCRDYYVCRNGEAVLLHCQKGMWFDDKNFVCNFPRLVNCPANID